MNGIDRRGAAWAHALGAHPSKGENPFIEDTPHHAAFEAGRRGEPFPEHLLVDVEDDER